MKANDKICNVVNVSLMALVNSPKTSGFVFRYILTYIFFENNDIIIVIVIIIVIIIVVIIIIIVVVVV